VDDAVADVARVAVAQEHVPAPLAARGDPPAVQALAVTRLELELAVVQTGGVRRSQDLPRREVQKRSEQ
jgi:hypothetical protein